ncbi:MAG: hypothetical protein JWN18_83 [Parcubacteria group bacterium]|nr:hypothetical protein [Parcubacteria group bacterium]
MAENKTSWGKVADWYSDYLGQEDTYQRKVILPNLLRILAPQRGERILDLGCGQGFFAAEVVKSGAAVVGADIAPELIREAAANVKDATFFEAPAANLAFAHDASFDAAYSVLALQNIEDLGAVFIELKRVLKPGGRCIAVVNHPAFRVLKRSSWGWDEKGGVQYRRVDGYLSGATVRIDMHPGERESQKTISYHRSLQDLFKSFTKSGLAVTRLEEWISHKSSETGPRQSAEDAARKEIPLFMALEMRVL